ncbi:MAG: ABC transporter permease [Pseudomonadota bacterium]
MDLQKSAIGLVFIGLIVLLWWSVRQGRREAPIKLVFGNPARTEGGGHWVVCGVSSLLLVWLTFSWDAARVFLPQAANELCQVAKVEHAFRPFASALSLSGEPYKSTQLLQRSQRQLDALAELGASADAPAQARQRDLLARVRSLLLQQADPDRVTAATREQISALALTLENAATALVSPVYRVIVDDAERARAAAQPAWGAGPTEIPVLPETERGRVFAAVSRVLDSAATQFIALRNTSAAREAEVSALRGALSRASESATVAADIAWYKQLNNVLRRVDDLSVFPTDTLAPLHRAAQTLEQAKSRAEGSLRWIDALALPGGTIVAGNSACSEQGSGRWLPKPSDTLATFLRMVDPRIGYKGLPLLWVEWKPANELVGVLLPDGLAALVPGALPTHAADGSVPATAKGRAVAIVTGQFEAVSVPWPTGHLWDSLVRVLFGLVMGVVLGVPLGLVMGLSRAAKGFFDPLIELYRPVPPLAWAPLILTVFGIHDDGKVFLLFMVAFAIMVVSARTGATGTQLSKVHAAHSLGASHWQILRRVILPNALPDILTGVRIAVGVCWGTLVAAEMLAGTTGLGFVENVARKQSDYEVIWVTIILLGLMGLAFDVVMRAVIRRATPWRGQG